MDAERRPQRGAWGIRVAAVVAALIVASGLVVRLSVSLMSGSPQAQQAVGGGVGELQMETDAGGTPLFDDVRMTPGAVAESCVRVRTRAAAQPGPTRLTLAGSDSPLADALLLRVTSGTGLDCSGGEVVADGRLVDHLAGTDGLWTDGGSPGIAERWYHFEVTMDPASGNELMGQRMDALSLSWDAELVPNSALSLPFRTVLFATGVAERSIIPLLWLLALSIGFVGIQSRIDRHDPKLALAPVDRMELEFVPR